MNSISCCSRWARSTVSAERKRCSKLEPVRRSRSLVCIIARRLPGVWWRASSTLQGLPSKTMTMPFLIWVADIAIKCLTPNALDLSWLRAKNRGRPYRRRPRAFRKPVSLATGSLLCPAAGKGEAPCRSDQRPRGVRSVLRVQLEEDAERDLIFEPPLLEPAAHLLDDEPRKLAQGLARARDGDLDGV